MRSTLVLALVFALTGCVSAPRGPHAEFRAGGVPQAPPAPVTATYVLHSSSATVEVRHAEKGQPVGFAQNTDGSVSVVAPDFEQPLTPGHYIWEPLPPAVGPTWVSRVCHRAADRLAMPAFLLFLLAGTAAYAVAASNWHR